MNTLFYNIINFKWVSSVADAMFYHTIFRKLNPEKERIRKRPKTPLKIKTSSRIIHRKTLICSKLEESWKEPFDVTENQQLTKCEIHN